jgi:hypothetical protein
MGSMPDPDHGAALVGAALAAALCTGCFTWFTPYIPPDGSPETIQAQVLLRDLVDRSPSDDRGMRVLGMSALAETGPGVSLGTSITEAIFEHFHRDRVFAAITRGADPHDLVLSGTIHRFYGSSGIGTLGWITLPIDPIWLLGFPASSDEGMVDIELSIAKPDGTAVGTYRGTAQFGGLYGMYNNRMLEVGRQLNTTFGDAVGQIRARILEDRARIEAAVAESGPISPSSGSGLAARRVLAVVLGDRSAYPGAHGAR